MRITIAFIMLAAASVTMNSSASAANFFHSVKDKTVVKECGACHMVYPPSLLPARSWKKIIDHLGDHFGEVATLPEPARIAILGFYGRGAADGSSSDGWFMRGVRPADTPARITHMPFWRAIHGGFSAASFKRPGVKKPGNCIGCHG